MRTPSIASNIARVSFYGEDTKSIDTCQSAPYHTPYNRVPNLNIASPISGPFKGIIRQNANRYAIRGVGDLLRFDSSSRSPSTTPMARLAPIFLSEALLLSHIHILYPIHINYYVAEKELSRPHPAHRKPILSSWRWNCWHCYISPQKASSIALCQNYICWWRVLHLDR